MAQTSWGFDGTINEAQWSEMAGLLGNGYVAADSASCVVTAVPGARSVSVSAGTLYGDGIVTVLDAAETVAMTTPVNGQWYVIALRRTWATNSTALVAIAGATTSTSTPTAPPSTLPTLNADPGVLTDQPIAWGWCNSANTTVVVYDMRQFPVRRMPLTVANNVVRDGIFQSPTQGQQVWRNDLGAVETYYGAYNAISNPGGRDSAGWYVDDRQTGLRPIQPTSAVIASGSGSANALGVVSFNNATAVSLNGVFSDSPTGFLSYRIVLRIITATSLSSQLSFRLRNAGTDDSSSNYAYAGLQIAVGGTAGAATLASATNHRIGNLLTEGNSSIIELHFPAAAIRTTYHTAHLGWNGAVTSIWNNGLFSTTAQFDGITFFPGAGSITGQVQVFGYND